MVGQDILCSWRLKLTAILMLLMFLMSCGAGSGESDDPSEDIKLKIGGKVLLGPLSGATVEVYKASDPSHILGSTTTDDSEDLEISGNFTVNTTVDCNEAYYIVAVSGGKDMDVDADGIPDQVPTENKGVVRVPVTGTQLKEGYIRVNMLTELVTNHVSYLLMAEYSDGIVLKEMERCARLLLSEDIDGDGMISYSDLKAFHPVDDKAALKRGWESLLACNRAVHNGDNLAPIAQTELSGLLGEVKLSKNITDSGDVVVSGNFAYVAGGMNGLFIMDISDPIHVEEVGYLDTIGSANSLVISDGYAFVADGDNGIQVIDIADPKNPKLGKSFNITGGNALNVALFNKKLCVAYGNKGIRILNIENPNLISEEGSLETFHANDVKVSGDDAYIATGTSGLHIVDINNLTIKTNVKTDGYADDITIFGEYAYIGMSVEGVQVVNISNPENPIRESHIAISDGVTDIDIIGNIAFLADFESCIQIVDISKPKEPRNIGRIRGLPAISGICVFDGFSLALSSNSLFMLDALNFAHVNNLWAVDTKDCAKDIVLQNGFAYVADKSGGLQVINIEKRKIVGALDTVGKAVSIKIVGDYVYLSDTSGGFSIIYVKEPSDPKLIYSYLDFADAFDVEVANGFAYVACSEKGIKVVDIQKPDNHPSIAFEYLSPINPKHIAISGQYAFIGGLSGKIEVLDINNPKDVKKYSEFQLPAITNGFEVYQNYLFTSDEETISVIDFSNKSNPKMLTQISGFDFLNGITIIGNYAYLSDNNAYMILDIHNPHMIKNVGYLPLLDYAGTLAMNNSNMIAADGWLGITVFKNFLAK